jgi:hypothetical protein
MLFLFVQVPPLMDQLSIGRIWSSLSVLRFILGNCFTPEEDSSVILSAVQMSSTLLPAQVTFDPYLAVRGFDNLKDCMLVAHMGADNVSLFYYVLFAFSHHLRFAFDYKPELISIVKV